MNKYIQKSIKGKSIISNAEINESIMINCDITTETQANIGSESNPFDTLYINQILPPNVVTDLITTNNPLIYNNGNISLNINNDTLEVLENELTVKNNLSVTNPLSYILNNISLNIDNTLEISNGNLKVVDNLNVTTPLVYSNKNLSLNIAAPFTISAGNLSIKLASTFDFELNNFEKIFVNDNNELDIDINNLIFARNGIKKLSLQDRYS